MPTLYPNTITNANNLDTTGGAEELEDHATWFTTTSSTATTSEIWMTFPTPGGNLTSNQTFKYYLRQSGDVSETTTWEARFDDGSGNTELIDSGSFTSSTSTGITINWDPANYSYVNSDGSGFELYISTSGESTASVGEINYVHWDAETDAPELSTDAADTSTFTYVSGQVSDAPLHGEVVDMGAESEIEVGIEYKTASESTWTTVTANESPMSSTGTFTANVSGLDFSTKYEFRAYAIGSEKYIDYNTREFGTDSLLTGVIDIDYGGSVGTSSDVEVYVTRVDTSVSPPDASIFTQLTTASDGSFEVKVPGDEQHTYHVAAQYVDPNDGTEYRGRSQPFIQAGNNLDISQSFTIDTFDDGTYDTTWTFNGNAGIFTRSGAGNGYAVTRTGGSQIPPFLRSDYEVFDRDFRIDKAYAEARMIITNDGYTALASNYDPNSSVTFYTFSPNDSQGNSIAIWEATHDGSGNYSWGNYVGSGTDDVTGRYIRVVGKLYSDGAGKAWVHEDDGSLIADVVWSDLGATDDGTMWGLQAGTTEETYVDWIKLHDDHPHLDDSYSP